MAPKKRRSDGEDINPTTVKPPNSNSESSRVTRSSTRRLNGSSSVDSSHSVAQSELPKTKKAKTSKIASADNVKSEEAPPPPPSAKVVVDSSNTKTIVIEHCKQCNSFKTRAIQVKNGLENGVSGITVLVNPEKPRRGCFEVREEGGEKFISLLDMKRPFAPMKALDMDKVITDVIDKVIK